MARVVNEPSVATQKQSAVRIVSEPTRSKSLLLILAAWSSFGASLLVPLLLIGLMVPLGPLAGVLLVGVYLVAMFVLLASGVLQLVAWSCMIVILNHRQHSTPVAIAFALVCLLGLDLLVLWFADWALVL